MRPTFEQIRRDISAIRLPEQGERREVAWVLEACLGVGRDARGAIEIFIVGPQLSSLSTLVQRHLRHDRWRPASGESFIANRLVLPADEHFVSVAAFVCEELVDRGLAAGDISEPFARATPIIELALKRMTLSDEAILGLLGELYVLRTLLAAAVPASRRELLDAWRGYEGRGPDFAMEGRRLEVKCTLSEESRHHIQGLSQVDPSRDGTGQPAETLRLISLGLRTAPPGEEGFLSLPQVVEDILALLGSPGGAQGQDGLRTVFLDRVRRYGAFAGAGYDHDAMRGWAMYAAAYRLRFRRVYDMNDPAVPVLRLEHLRGTRVEVGSVSFVVTLPERITGDLNPEADLERALRNFLSM